MITSELLAKQDKAQNEVVNYVSEVVACYRLICDYSKRPQAVEETEAKIGVYNCRMIATDAVNLNNRYICGWLALLTIAAWYVIGGWKVIEGEELGTFITNVGIFQTVGESWIAIFNVTLEMEYSLPYLQKIVIYMNLPIDLDQRQRHNRKRRAAGEDARDAARGRLQQLDHELSHVHFAADLMPITLSNVSYTYDPPELIDARRLGHSRTQEIMEQYSGATEKHDGSLKNCTMSFPQGAFVVLVGLPGDGKSTLMKLIGGQLIPDSGDLLIPPHLRVLHISQEPLFLIDTIYNNLIYGVAKGDVNGDAHLDRVIRVCQRLGVSEKIYQYLDPENPLYDVKADWEEVLSQTQRVQLSLARAFIANPEILLIHKPTVVFNDTSVERTFQCLREFVKYRGLLVDPKLMHFRRLRTCIITTARETGVVAADKVFKVEPHGVTDMTLQRHTVSGTLVN